MSGSRWRRQSQRAERLRGEFAAERHRLAVFAAGVGDVLERAQDRRRERIEAAGDARIAAIDGVKELHQIVRADGEEIDMREQFVELVEQRRHLDHAADLDLVGQLVAVAAQVRELALDQFLRLVEFARRSRSWET